MRFIIQLFIISFFTYPLLSCHSGGKEEEAGEGNARAETPVTITTISTGPMVEYIYLNATATFLQKSYVKANANGYIQSVNTQVGKYTNDGQLLFTIKTKEAQSIGNTISKLDPTFKFTGVNKITATGSGFITQLNHQPGDYVQDGEQLAVISDKNSFAFVLNIPYELRAYVLDQKNVEIILPDSTRLTGTIASVMPSVDPASQTQSVVIKVPASSTIPENLIARVKIVKTAKSNTTSLPKEAVLTNDVQSEFWVMKMINANNAVKVVVQKGIETKDRIEILSPAFSPSDKILVSGNYGLGDTANVKATQ